MMNDTLKLIIFIYQQVLMCSLQTGASTSLGRMIMMNQSLFRYSYSHFLMNLKGVFLLIFLPLCQFLSLYGVAVKKGLALFGKQGK